MYIYANTPNTHRMCVQAISLYKWLELFNIPNGKHVTFDSYNACDSLNKGEQSCFICMYVCIVCVPKTTHSISSKLLFCHFSFV